MNHSRHPAHRIPFDELLQNLRNAVAAKRVFERIHPEHPELRLFGYTNATVYDKDWDDTTRVARGLVLNVVDKRIAATTLPKFFNFTEGPDRLPDESFDVYEKLDGSLIIAFCHRGRWICCTRGSFTSDQSKWAAFHLFPSGLHTSFLEPDETYLLEATYAANRVVVGYPEDKLTLLGGYTAIGYELPDEYLARLARLWNLSLPRKESFASLPELLTHCQSLPATEEGFVVRFQSGLRVKFKGSEYCRIHRLISNVTPLAIWGVLANDGPESLDAIRAQIPEAFHGDFDAIRRLLVDRVVELLQEISVVFNQFAHASDKEVGLALATMPERVRPFIFVYRKEGTVLKPGTKIRDTFFRMIRPTSNVLEGYQPSGGLNRVLEDTL